MTLADMLPFVDIMTIDFMPYLTWKSAVLGIILVIGAIHAYRPSLDVKRARTP